MRNPLTVLATASVLVAFSLGAPLIAQEKKAEEKKAEEKKAEEKKGPEKVAGDVGLLDLEKNYMIVVTKEGKLVTLDFDQKMKVIVNKEDTVKMSEVGLGSSAVVEYTEKGEKKTLTKMEFSPAKCE